MHFQYIPYLWVLIASAVVTAVLGVYAGRQRDVPGAVPFTVLMTAATAWALANALENAGVDLPTKLFWANVQYVSYVPISTAWLLLALQYEGRRPWLMRGTLRVALLLMVPLLVAALAWTNDLHELLRRNVYLDTAGPFPLIGKTYGPAFWVHIAYNYTLFGTTAFLFIRAQRHALPLYRGQALVLLVSLVLPLVSSALYAFDLTPISGQDVTPAVFSLCGLAVTWGLFRYRLFDLVPVARTTVVESMDDGVIVLDTRNRIVDINPAARSILSQQDTGRHPLPSIGDQANKVFEGWADLLRLAQNPTLACIESVVENGDRSRIYELRSSPLADDHPRSEAKRDQRGHPIGQVITVRDITQRRHTEAMLLQQQEHLAVMRDRERLARELHDGLAQDLAGLRMRMGVWHKLIETDLPRLRTELDTVRGLLSQNIREVRRTIYALRPLALDEMGFFAALRQFVRDLSEQTQLPIDLRVVGPQERLPERFELVIFRIIQEALYNVCKHAQAREVCIELDLRVKDRVTLIVHDDGQGFDPAILDEAVSGGHLGLAQMRGRVQDLSGQFALTSRPGQGTEIKVTLPTASDRGG